MRILISVISVFFVISFCGPTSAQELSHYYTPNGFSMPMLEGGEYSISLRGYYDRGLGNSSAENPFYGNYDQDSRNYYLSVGGTIAVNRQFLIRGELSYYPRQTAGDYKYHYAFIFPFDTSISDYQRLVKQKISLQPQLLLAYRPLQNLEISIGARYSSVTSDIMNLPTVDLSDDVRSKWEMQTFYFNVTYLGKL
ncbi:MAG: hypothetical protein NT002_02570 [candidate division Zixibacteria bacterium]|nr:hypothetical protein [candidate division Zixibacteria bacterium]